MTIKTVADFKRLPVGTRLTLQSRNWSVIQLTRSIEIKQTNAIKFDDGSWLEYPKASDFRVAGDDIIITATRPDGSVWSELIYKLA